MSAILFVLTLSAMQLYGKQLAATKVRGAPQLLNVNNNTDLGIYHFGRISRLFGFLLLAHCKSTQVFSKISNTHLYKIGSRKYYLGGEVA